MQREHLVRVLRLISEGHVTVMDMICLTGDERIHIHVKKARFLGLVKNRRVKGSWPYSLTAKSKRFMARNLDSADSIER